MSKEPTPSKKPECLKREPSPRGVALGPSCVERSLPPRMAAPKLGPDETTKLLSRVLGAGDEDPDLNTLSAALKARLEVSHLKKPPPPHVPWCGTVAPGVKSAAEASVGPLWTTVLAFSTPV